MDYSDKVLDHFTNPRNMGEIEGADGCGEVGNSTCGDIMKLWIKVDENGIITDARFKTFGCASAIASSSIATEMIIGKHVEEARTVTNQAIVEALEGLPEEKIHCSVLAAEAINNAIDDYMGIEREGDESVICVCMNVTRGQVKDAILHGASTAAEVKEKTGAGAGACQGRRCGPVVAELLQEYKTRTGEDNNEVNQ